MALKKNYVISIIIIGTLLIFFCYFYFNNINKSELNINYEKYISEKNLENIIDNNVAPSILNEEKINDKEKTFCDFKVIDISKNNDNINVYLWILAQNFSVKNNKLIEGVGGEFPVILKLKEENNDFKFINYDISKALEESESIKIFPKSVRKKATENEILNESLIQNKANTYFGIFENKK
ncbi:MAG: hypothetical protein RR904_06665 [Bacilli bacterium]